MAMQLNDISMPAKEWLLWPHVATPSLCFQYNEKYVIKTKTD